MATYNVIVKPDQSVVTMAKIYQGITLISIMAKFHKALLLNSIEQEIEKILWKNQKGFWRNQSTTSQILTIC